VKYERVTGLQIWSLRNLEVTSYNPICLYQIYKIQRSFAWPFSKWNIFPCLFSQVFITTEAQITPKCSQKSLAFPIKFWNLSIIFLQGNQATSSAHPTDSLTLFWNNGTSLWIKNKLSRIWRPRLSNLPMFSVVAYKD
jgi:hypothetical protein